VYDPKRIVNVRGISSCTERTLGEIEMGLSTENHETKHIFHVFGDGIRIPYDGILGLDFFIRGLELIIREMIMGDVRLKFNDRVLSDK
jgi:hypothetical protein